MENGIPKPENSDELAAVESNAEGSVAPASEIAVAAEPVAEIKAASMLVVLAKRENSVRSTVNFLERRGFAAKYVATLNEAVELFSKKEANMLLLSMNFSHPKVEMLPALMNQSFKIETIVYAEDSDRKTSNKLSNSKSKHVLFGPVSGPVVMMKIRQIDREMSGEGDDAAGSADKRVMSSKDEEGDIKVGGRKASNDDTVVLNGRTDAKAKTSFDTAMKSLADGIDETEDESSDALARSGETYIQKGDRSKMKSAGGDASDADESEPLSEQAQAMRQGLDRGLTEAPAGAKRGRLIMPNSFKRPSSKSGADDALPEESNAQSAHEAAAEALRRAEHEKAVETAKKKSDREAAEAAKKAEREAELASQKAERESLAAKQRAEREETAAKMKAEREASAVKAKSDRDVSLAAKKSDRESADIDAKAEAARSQVEKQAAEARAHEAAVARARDEREQAEEAGKASAKEPAAGATSVDQVLTEAEKLALTVEEKVRRCLHESLAIVAGAPKNEMHQLTEHASAALISLRTTNLNCAFVVSLNYAKQTANELFHRMEIAFFSLLRDHGIEFENNQTHSIFLDNMNIVREAFASSEFSVITHTNDIEMGAAKVYVTNPVPKTELYEENMHSINLRDLPLDQPVTFNLFLHFKQNHKFLRYLKIGSVISDQQVDRLASRHVLGLVEQAEVEAYRRHYAAHAIHALKKPAA